MEREKPNPAIHRCHSDKDPLLKIRMHALNAVTHVYRRELKENDNNKILKFAWNLEGAFLERWCLGPRYSA